MSPKSKMKHGLPPFIPPPQNVGRKKRVWTTEEWLDSNEYFVSDMWYYLHNYIQDSNVVALDRCKYTDFCQFVADNTTLPEK